ncbi:hypothetical protein DPMN_188019 [Dreissena polymorpha]|uniref:Uncharacterized protein n=1 Tax=Dreissena polymorpha TaxID=45954 RepID=A0A9D4IAX7_DREPO|nr:hypothetical protein DPMN_188019 [Dreissena polymorpha]
MFITPKLLVISFADSVISLMETAETGESGLHAPYRVVTERKPAQGPVQTRLLPTMDLTALGLMLSKNRVRTSFVRV